MVEACERKVHPTVALRYRGSFQFPVTSSKFSVLLLALSSWFIRGVMKTRVFPGVIAILALSLAAAVAAQQYDTAALMKFRSDREATLKADNGWLTVAGLHFLNQGENRVGSDPSNDIVLDFPSVPKHAGIITMNGTAVRIKAADGQTLTINDKPVKESELHGAFDNKPTDTVNFGGLTFFVHYSGPRLALRVRDQKSPIRANFTRTAVVRSESGVSHGRDVQGVCGAQDRADSEHPRRPRTVQCDRHRHLRAQRRGAHDGSVEVGPAVVVCVSRSDER